MSILMVNEDVNFNDLKQMLEVTDGNLATHLQTLEESGYIKVQKGFVGRKTNTTYAVTKTGEKAFNDHISGLEKLIKGIRLFFFAHILCNSKCFLDYKTLK